MTSLINPSDPEGGQYLSGRVKLCCIKLRVKFSVIAVIAEDGEPQNWFWPVGEIKTTQRGDKWGSKGQGGKNQELTLEIEKITQENMMIYDNTAMTPVEIDMGSTTLDPNSSKKQDIDVVLSVCFVCCTCLLADGTGELQNAEECCTLENFTPPGGGHLHGLGGWLTGPFGDPANPHNRTPDYTDEFFMGPPDDPLKNLRESLKGRFRSDVMMNCSRSVYHTCCWQKEDGPPPPGPNGGPPPKRFTGPQS